MKNLVMVSIILMASTHGNAAGRFEKTKIKLTQMLTSAKERIGEFRKKTVTDGTPTITYSCHPPLASAAELLKDEDILLIQVSQKEDNFEEVLNIEKLDKSKSVPFPEDVNQFRFHQVHGDEMSYLKNKETRKLTNVGVCTPVTDL